MILFSDIYDKAIKLFDDPDIRRAYKTNKIQFQQTMYPYLQNGISSFNSPETIAFELIKQEEPEGKMETFDGNGDNVYTLTTTPHEHSTFVCRIGTKIDSEAVYDKESNAVTFSEAIPVGTQGSVSWYYGGCFLSDFADTANAKASAEVIISYVGDILARVTVLSWAEEEKNFVLDIRNLLTDTDFKIYSPANSVQAKIKWVAGLQFQLDTKQNKLAWMMFSQYRRGGRQYGP